MCQQLTELLVLLMNCALPSAGEYIKTWRRRWFVLKQGKIFWFKSDIVDPVSTASQHSPPCLVRSTRIGWKWHQSTYVVAY